MTRPDLAAAASANVTEAERTADPALALALYAVALCQARAARTDTTPALRGVCGQLDALLSAPMPDAERALAERVGERVREVLR